MKNTSLFRRVLSVVLTIAMLFTLLVPAVSAEQGKASTTEELTLTPVDRSEMGQSKADQGKDSSDAQKDYAPDAIVRVSIVLDKASTISAGYSTVNIAKNASAMAYRAGLRDDQAAVTSKVEAATGSKLDVKWNLTLAANIISANVQYGQIETIKAVDGVKDVFLENRYEPEAVEAADEPDNGSASYMIGATYTWANGYYGAGSKVAIIDTGAMVSHQSFDSEAFEYALAENAELAGLSVEDYKASLNLITGESIAAVASQLNSGATAGQAYVNSKIPYGYNYVDNDYDITHNNDTSGDHGSHVAGIATANRFIKVDEEFVPALEAVGTQGVAPDAQLIVMKVFGKGGGAYDSDYMVAIEDSIILGCDSANLSLGSGSPGFTFSSGYEEIMNELVGCDTVVATSASNSYAWYETPYNPAMYGYLLADDVSFTTAGSPGTYPNTLAVASVDNQGSTGKPLYFGDLHVFYSETDYGQAPIASLANVENLEYIFFENFGADGDGNSLLTEYAEAIEGKIVLVSRGTSSFYQKVNAAAGAGAIGCIIYNNQAGTINMNLEGITTTIPAVAISQADGQAIKAQSEAVLSEETGAAMYYLGTMSVGDAIEVQIPEVSDTVTISSFSSWGVPGSLILKPEILAPGGNIYSVYGYGYESGNWVGGADQYTSFSGTSMASPQVAGMAAVMGQYIRENNLTEKTGLSIRTLSNSLLMSTAHPVFDSYGDYHPVIRVGAGLANVGDATRATSYITMSEDATLFPDSAKDGKVKAELGDDPDYCGEYEYAFTVNPLDEPVEVTFRTDIFVQWLAGNGGYGMLQDYATTLISADTTYEVNGQILERSYNGEADVNRDDKTDGADAQAILDYLTGELEDGASINLYNADVDGDGEITTRDARQILEGAKTVTVVIDEPTEVTVRIKLDEDDRDFLLNYFTNGFYVQGYTYVETIADEEGVQAPTHSIPILGFCGSWTDAAMMDRSSVIDEAYGTGVPETYLNNSNTNFMTVKNEKGSAVYMGNPYTVEENFPADRLALNGNDTIQSFTYSLIRNAGTLGFAIQDEEGNILFSQVNNSGALGAYYYVNGAAWYNTGARTYNANKSLASLGLEEGDTITVGFYALPEYYALLNAKANGEVATSGTLDNEGFKAILQSGIVGEGASIKYTVTLDNTAPEVLGAYRDLITGDVTVTAQDNAYVAYVGITNKSGSKEFAAAVPEQSEAGEQVTASLDLEGQSLPSEVLLVVGDYAGNEVAYKVNLGGGSSNEGGQMLGFVGANTSAAPGSGNRAWNIDRDELWYNDDTGEYGGLSLAANLGFKVTAAEYVDGYVFMAADDGWFYVAELNALDEAVAMGIHTNDILDMAFNYRDGNMYLLDNGNNIFVLDLLTGEQIQVAHITLGGTSAKANRLAIDDQGVFYTASEGTTSDATLYKFEVSHVAPEEPEEPEEPLESAYSWGFETEAEISTWTFVDADGDGYNWTWNQNISSWFSTSPDFDSFAAEGTGCLVSGSYINTVGALSPDNWAISPAFDLTGATSATVSFMLKSVDTTYPEQVQVYAGTSTNTASLTAISSSITSPAEYQQYTADLSAFAGQSGVRVAFRNSGTYDMYLVDLDVVEILVANSPAVVSQESRAVEQITAEKDAVRGTQPVGSAESRSAGSLVKEANPDAINSTDERYEPAEGSVGWSFETAAEVASWTFSSENDVDWLWSPDNLGGYDYTGLAHEGNSFIMAYSYVDYVGAFQADNWAISPIITLGEDSVLSFYATNANADYPEPVSLYLVVSGSEDMIQLDGNVEPASGFDEAWTYYQYDLSDYAGQNVCIAFHDENYDGYEFWLDQVEVTSAELFDAEPEEPEEPEEPADAIVWDFETATDVASWFFSSNGESDWVWSVENPSGYDYSEVAYSGENFILSYSFVDYVGAFQAHNYAISPIVTLGEDSVLSFYATNANSEYPEIIDVVLFASGEEEAVMLAEDLSVPTGYDAWTRYEFDLSDYAGRNVCIGFYDECYDAYEIWIDLVSITNAELVEIEPVEPEPDPIEEVTAVAVGNMGVYNRSNGGSMAWDHESDELYLASNWNDSEDYDHYLWIVDTESGAASRANYNFGSGNSYTNNSARLYGAVSGLVIVPGGESQLQPTDVATDLYVQPWSLNMLKGQSTTLKVAVLPWTLTNKDVTFDSADPAIASVNDNGVVTANGEGETIITVTTIAEPNLSVEVSVHVDLPPEAELRGIIWDENGVGQAGVFSSNAPADWTAAGEAGNFYWATRVEDRIYASDDENLYVMDADTYEVENLGAIVLDWVPSDAEAVPEVLVEAFAAMGYANRVVVGLCYGGSYLELLDPEGGSLVYWDLTGDFDSPMATLAYAGMADESTAAYYMMTESGNLYALTMDTEGYLNYTELGNTGVAAYGVSNIADTRASMTFDAESGFLFLALYDGNGSDASLYAIDPADLSRVACMGDFGEDVWPVVGLYQYEPLTDLTMTVNPTELSMFVGDEANVKIKVKLGETNEFTVESSDETVAIYEDGVVKGLKAGEATLTVTTVDTNEEGEHLSAEIEVVVKGLHSIEAFIQAQVTDENGQRFANINLEDLAASSRGTEAPFSGDSGARTGDIYMLASGGNIVALDANTFEPVEYEFDSYYSELPAMDIANYPMFVQASGLYDTHKALFTTEPGYLVTPDYYGWNLSSYIPGMAGIAFCGARYDESNAAWNYFYAIIDSDGELYMLTIDATNGSLEGLSNILSTGISVEDQTNLSMAYIETVNDNYEVAYAGFVIANNEDKGVYFVDIMGEEFTLEKFGNLAVDNITGLVGSFDGVAFVDEEPDPLPEPTDPGEYPEPNEELLGIKTLWDFETDPEAAGWSFVSRDFDGYDWIWTPGSDYSELAAYEGVGMIVSNSYVNNVGALNPDNFAITPAIDLSDEEDANFAFYAKGQDASWAAEVFAVYAGTSADLGEMVKISEDFTATGTWQMYTASLADFAGEEEVYVAIRHYNVTDMYMLDVDYCMVLTADGEPLPEPQEPIFGWYFEDAAELEGWEIIDANGDNKTFERYSTSSAYEGGYVLSNKWSTPPASVDDYAITPAMDLSGLASAELSFAARSGSSSFSENMEVLIGTSADPAEMEVLMAEETLPNSWTLYSFDLSAYAGEEEVYLAFHHLNSVDQMYLWLDQVEVFGEEGEEQTLGEFSFIEGWSFEESDSLDDWTIINANNDSYTFERKQVGASTAHDGEWVLSDHWASPNCSDYAITPALDLSNLGRAELKYFARGASTSNYWETLTVLVGTSPDPAEMDVVIPQFTVAQAWTEYSVDLADYLGEDEVYVAFYHDAPDQYYLYIDSVEFWGAEYEAGGDPLYFYTGFEEADSLEGWTLLSLDSDNNTFERYNSPSSAYDGSYSLSSKWCSNASVNDWAITPALDASGSDELYINFFASATGSAEYIAVYAGTEADPETMTLMGKEHINYGDNVRYEFDLSEFAGEPELYVAIVHCDAYDQWRVCVDEVEICTESVSSSTSASNTEKIPGAVNTSVDFTAPAIELNRAELGTGTAKLSSSARLAYNVSAEMSKLGEAENKASGSTNAIKGEATVTALRTVADDTAYEGLVRIELKEDMDVRNGLYTISYNADRLTFEDAMSALPFSSIHHEIVEPAEGEPALRVGVVTFAFASAEAIPADTSLLALRFSYTEQDLNTTIVITPLERNDEVEPDDTLVIEVGGHNCPCAAFEDMPEYGTPEHEAIDWAFENGITAGMSETLFGTGTTLTRAQAATFLYAAAGRPEFDETAAANNFSDVPAGKWYTKAVLWAAANGYVAGYSDGTFRPGVTLTRGQILVILYAVDEKPSVEGLENPYSDVEADKWFTNAAIWAYNEGIEQGEDGVFAQSTECTRETFVLYLYRYMTGNCLLGQE